MREIILASGSERRARILEDCGIGFKVVSSGAEEVQPEGKHISDIVEINAEKKAKKIAEGYADSVIVGADTLVIQGDKIIGKPADENEARYMLNEFSGGEVDVYTGLCVIDTASGREAKGHDKSSLNVANLNDGEIKKLFPLLGPYDKAGGFSIEGVGALIFDDIKGSYFNILGLPMMLLRKLFSEIELDILDHVKETR